MNKYLDKLNSDHVEIIYKPTFVSTFRITFPCIGIKYACGWGEWYFLQDELDDQDSIALEKFAKRLAYQIEMHSCSEDEESANDDSFALSFASAIEEFENGLFLTKHVQYREGTEEIDQKDFWHAFEHLAYARKLFIKEPCKGKEEHDKWNAISPRKIGCPCDKSCCKEYHFKLLQHLKDYRN